MRAIYLQGHNARPERLSREIRQVLSSGANGIVFDVKDIIGVVNYRSRVKQVEEVRTHQPPIPDLDKTIKFLHDRGIYVIARMALFQDETLARRRPDLAVSNSAGPLLTKGRPLWVEPGRNDVQYYNLSLVRELIDRGVDEIQFDYVRYPAEGDLRNVTYYGVKKSSDKIAHLKRFLASAWFMTRGTNVKTAIDIFGVTAWGEPKDVASTGQQMEELAPFVDVISPMLYPSHFAPGFRGFANPADHPHYFYYEGVSKIRKRTGSRVIIRPWIQAFPLRVTVYNGAYLLKQIQGSNDAGGQGWMMWNAGNIYGLVYRAVARPRERSEKPR